jgi:hypothetical protein
MGVQLPKYSQQVAPSGAGTGVLADPSKAGAGWETSAKLIGAGLELGQDYLAKKADLKESADLADYEVRKRGFRQTLEDMETDALLEGVGQEELQEKVYQPAIEKFQGDLQNMGYSKNSLGQMLPDWNNEVSKIGVELASKQNKRQIADYNIRQRDYAEQLMIEGDEEGSNAIWDALEGTTRPGEAKEWKSLAGYKISDRAMQAAEGLRLDGTYTDEQYFDALGEIDKQINASKMLSHHKQSARINITAKINNFKGKRNKRLTQANDEIFEKIAKDDFEPEDLVIIREDVGQEMADGLEKSLSIQLYDAKKFGDKDAIKLVGILDKMVNEGDSWVDAIKKIGDVTSPYGVAALAVANKYAKDITMTQDTIVAYENFFARDQRIAVDGNTRDFVRTLSYYLNRKVDGQAAFANKQMKAFAQWQESDDSTYEDFKNKQFGGDAKMDAQSIPSPNIPLRDFGSVEDAEAANLLPGTFITIGGRRARFD